MKAFTGRASRSELDRWWAAVDEGRTTDDLPRLRGSGEADPAAAPRVGRPQPTGRPSLQGRTGRRHRRGRAARRPAREPADPDTLRTVSWEPPATVDVDSVGAALAALDARPWQVEATAAVIADAFGAAADPSAAAAGPLPPGDAATDNDRSPSAPDVVAAEQGDAAQGPARS